MLKEERFEVILSELENNKKVRFEDLAVQLHVSEDTIRRDIDALHRNGLLSKARGGAIPREKDPLTFHDRQSFLNKEKDIIALKSQRFIKNGMTVFLDGGTTILAVINAMPIDIKIRIVTNNYSVVTFIENYKNIELILLGGNYDRDLAITSGLTTSDEASKYIADLYIMGTCAIDPYHGISASYPNDGEIKKMMVRSSKYVIALASRNKLYQTGAFKVCDIRDVDILITDLASNDNELDDLRKTDMQIV